ncbi:MAG: alpha/beta hydrolase [Verrucomicrobia bacterium]|nr:alpha/beta hydrolase [Verrucomicrobiota bacterium]
MSDGLIEGFARRRLPGYGIEVDALVGGSGPPLLLLHGYPETRLCWSAVAPQLAENFTVVVPDLRGYGRSGKPVGDAGHTAYSKRIMARDQIATMAALGFERFRVAGHDRGARVTYRLALDHPSAVERIALIDIVPTDDMWAVMNGEIALKAFHWTFQIQSDDFPERLIGADPEFFLRWTLNKQAHPGFEFPQENLADYIECLQDPAAIHGFCEDYRAGWFVDRELDLNDRGKKRIESPVLVLWGDRGFVSTLDPLSKWRAWAEKVQGHAITSGHFIPEEASEEVVAALQKFMLP